jgi:hypothetical protein
MVRSSITVGELAVTVVDASLAMVTDPLPTAREQAFLEVIGG